MVIYIFFLLFAFGVTPDDAQTLSSRTLSSSAQQTIWDTMNKTWVSYTEDKYLTHLLVQPRQPLLRLI